MKHINNRKEQAGQRARQQAVARLRKSIMSNNPNLPVADSAEDVFAALQLPEEVVQVPALGRAFLVRGLTVREAADINQKSMVIKTGGAVGIDFEKRRIWRLLYSVKNPQTGKPLFNPAEHYYRLANAPDDVWEPVFKVIARFAGEAETEGDGENQGAAEAEAVFRA